ncbi:unnamed protein product [Haemonchus placei]|uniref:C2H2-type domain-containing protein n=1 Tax=Haemonchus placei TaxID=6290 RepID=A0A0N4VRZ0_HAEPC|nr:unnamed protein product [Haemonchus placei]
MLQSPIRIFRCYICVEHRLAAPLQDLSLLIEHLAKHYEFHLYECRGCKLKFVTPFIANFHIKEGKCKKEEGELCDDGGPPLDAIDLDTVDFEMFCHLQNAITKCTELMLYELNYGEEELLNCLVFNREPAVCPVSPDPITKRDGQMQTSPPTTEQRLPSRPVLSATSTVAQAPATEAVPNATEDNELIDGYSLVSDEELEPLKQSQSYNIEADEGLSTISNSPSTAATQSPQQSPRTPGSSASFLQAHSPPSSTSIPSLMSLKVKELFDRSPPPRTDRRQEVVLPDQPQAMDSTVYVEADSSSTLAGTPEQPPLFFQAQPAYLSKSLPNVALPSNEPVYPVLAPVYSDGVRVNSGPFQQVYSLHHGQDLSLSTEPAPMSYPQHSVPSYGLFPPNAEVSPPTMEAPQSQRRRPSSATLYQQYQERIPGIDQINSCYVPLDDNRCTGGRPYDREQLPPHTVEDGNDMAQSRRHRNEWIECGMGHSIESRIHFEAEMNGRSENVVICRHERGSRQRHSYGITVLHSVDPHFLESNIDSPQRRKSAGSGRKNRARSRTREKRKRSKTVDSLRTEPKRSRSQRINISRSSKAGTSRSTTRHSDLFERTPLSRRRRSESPDRFQMFPASILDGDDMLTRRDDGMKRSVDSDDRDVVVKTEPSPSREDHEMRDVIERLRARASRLKNSGNLSHYSEWKKRQSKRPQFLWSLEKKRSRRC